MPATVRVGWLFCGCSVVLDGTEACEFVANPVMNWLFKPIGDISFGKKNTVADWLKKSGTVLSKKINGNGAAQFIDKHVYTPLGKFIQKHSLSEKVKIWGFPILLGGYIAKNMADSNAIEHDAQRIKRKLLNDSVKYP